MESKSKDFYFQPNRNHEKTKTDLKIVRPTEKKVMKKSEVFTDLKRGISKPIKRNNLDLDTKEESSKSSSCHDLKLPIKRLLTRQSFKKNPIISILQSKPAYLLLVLRTEYWME